MVNVEVLRAIITAELKGTREVGVGFRGLNTSFNNFSKSMADAEKKTKAFRFEFLGLMFAGMAMTRIFSSMLRPAAEMFGLFDLWTSTLQVLFLPVMDLIMPLLIRMMEWFMNLPEGVQLAIGIFAIFGLGIGKLFATIGQLALAFDSIIIAGPAVLKFFKGFGGVTKIFGVMKTAALFLFSPAGLVLIGIALLVVAIVLLIKHWDKVKIAAIKTWNAIKDVIESVINKIILKMQGIAVIFDTIFGTNLVGKLEELK